MAQALLYVYCSINPVSGDRARLASVAFKFVIAVKWLTVPMLNKKTLDMQTRSALGTVKYAHVNFWGDLNLLPPALKLL